MISRGDVDLSACFLLKPFQDAGQGFMPFPFAVLGQVAGNEQHIRVVLFNRVEQGVQKRLALRKHLAIAVEMLCKVLRVLDQGGRQIVGVGEGSDFQTLLLPDGCAAALADTVCPISSAAVNTAAPF